MRKTEAPEFLDLMKGPDLVELIIKSSHPKTEKYQVEVIDEEQKTVFLDRFFTYFKTIRLLHLPLNTKLMIRFRGIIEGGFSTLWSTDNNGKWLEILIEDHIAGIRANF